MHNRVGCYQYNIGKQNRDARKASKLKMKASKDPRIPVQRSIVSGVACTVANFKLDSNSFQNLQRRSKITG